jgi:hypothetical protein
MRPLSHILAVLCLALLAPVTGFGQAPANDLFANAITINGPIATVMGSNVGATKPFGPGGEPSIGPGLGNFGGASVWWNWTAAASGQTTIDTEGSDFNTLLGVFTGEVQNALTLVAGNDNFEGNPWSRVTFNAIAGTTYRIMVDGFRSGPGFGAPATGNIKLNVKGVGGLDLSLTNGMVFTVGEPIPVSVNFTPDFPNPPATRVNFYRRGSPFTPPVLFATDDTEPFSAVAENVPAGSNTIYVAAIDSLGNPVESPAASVLVQNVGVTLLRPFEDTMYLNATSITVTAWGYLPAGTLTNVEFLVDGVKFAESDTPPYSGAWTSLTPGSHRFTAVGRSDTGARYVSQPVNIGVAGTLLPNRSVWKYLDNGSDQGTAWREPDFDDSSWASGLAPLGYGDSAGRPPATTNVFGPDANAKYITTYYRQAAVISNAASFARINLNIERDDGAVVYLNGTELGRFNMPTGDVTSATLALNAGDDGVTIASMVVPPALLPDGVNVFAVEIHQDAGNSSDIWFQMNLQGIPVIIHNLSPEVTLTTPVADAWFLAPTEIALEATASDADGSVAKVEFFAGTTKIGEDAEAPYEAVWNNPPITAHILTAVATDDQGATTTSAEIPVVVYDAIGTPVGKITAPPDGHVVEGPTNMLVTATANATNGVANVRFLNNGVEFASDTTAPFSALWPAPFGTNVLTVEVTDATGSVGTSPSVTVVVTIPPTNVTAPTVFAQTPLAGETVTNLTSIRVLFSERVLNVDAGDLLINGAPATGLTSNGSLTNYVFTFAEPPFGPVKITWTGGHGMTDYGYPDNLPFDENGPGATWSYNFIDKRVPVITTRTPAPGAIVTNLTEIRVTFNEPVAGVDAQDLLVNGAPALAMTGSGVDYTFAVPTPPSSGTTTVNVTWTTNNGIFDLASEPNAFVGTLTNNTWRFVYDPRVTLVQSNSTWRFIKGLAEASDPISAWRAPGFDDSGWSNAPAPFFFGDPYTNANIRGTLLSDMNSNYTSIYLRKEFNVENRGEILSLLLNHQSDDGFIAWLNGFEVLRYNVPSGANGDHPYNTNASAAATEPGNAGAAYIVATLTNAAVSRLVNGRNVLAIHAFNQNLTNSSDFGFNAQLYYFPIDPSTVPPRVVSTDPAGGDLFYLTNVTFSFSEGVSGVDAADLLINGVPATSVTSSTNSIYTFHFPQPPYGPVAVTWDTNHAIADFDDPPRAFDGSAAASRVNYFLLNPSAPRIATRAPAPNTVLTGLTSITVTFDEPVTGVDASDFLVSGAPAADVATADGITYNFGFTQPPFGTVTIRWATNSGITDLSEPPAFFDPVRFGAQWSYTLIDPIPSITLTSPTNNTFFLPPARITVRATASDNDGTVALVELFESDAKLGESNGAPFSLTLSNLDVGAYTFTGRVTDNQGLQRTSAPVVINVVTSLPIRLVRGPYLQIGSPTGGVVRWRTDAISDGLVNYGTDLNSLTNVAWETTVTNEHIVRIGGLEPDTKYYYSIGSAAFRLVGGTNDGANYWFQTSPPVGTRRPYRFWALGDAGTAGNGAPDRQQSTRDAFYNFAAADGRQPDAWLLLGDNAYNVGSDAEHQAAVFDMYPTTLRNKFVWPTIGNHETSQSTTATDFPYLHIFSLPTAGEAGGVPSGTEKYYSFDHGNIHFICLDSMTSGYTGTTPMARWLEDDLTQTAAEWIIVFFHHPPYTKGSHNSDTEQDLVQIRQNLVPIMEAHGVDLVLSGHSHCYERSYLLDGHYGLSDTLTESMKIDGGNGQEEGDGPYRKNEEGRGVVYTVAGSSGQATFLSADAPHEGMFFTMLQLGSLVIDVDGNRLDATFLRETGETPDHFTLIKPPPFPPAPQHLVAVPTSGTGISLAWIDAADNELGYSVERSTDGVNFTVVATLPADTIATLDISLSENTTYFYRVRGTNSIGVGDYSNIASASTVTPTAPPAAPVGLVARSDNGAVFFRSQMVLRWQDRSTNEAAFQIERSSDGASFTPVATVAADLTSYVDRQLSSATFYYYRVRAVNSVGHSPPSGVASEETHPQTQLARLGDRVVFHAGVEGTRPILYQWRFLGAPLAGETNETLVLSNVQLADEGAYSVVVRDPNGRVVSNPAYLFVLAAPGIIAQPQDLVAIAGTPAGLVAAANGTPPLRYQWMKDGTPLPGASSPMLTFPSVQLGDRGNYYLLVENDFGTAASEVARLDVFVAPTLAPVPDAFAEVLTRLTISNVVTDPNVPPLKLVYSLDPGAPTNATINPSNGVFRWTPNRSQAPGTNQIIARVTDATRPLISGMTTFTVYVNDYLEVTAGSVILQTGETNSVPLDIFSSAPLQGLQCVLRYPQDRLANLWLEPLVPDITTATFQAAGADTATLTFTAVPGQSLVGTQRVARLHFTAPAQSSAFVRLDLDNTSASLMAAGVAPTHLVNDGRVVVVGARPLLEARINSGIQREVILYGRRNTAYVVEYATNLVNGGVWRPRATVFASQMTNLTQSLLLNQPPPPVYYRARQQ